MVRLADLIGRERPEDPKKAASKPAAAPAAVSQPAGAAAAPQRMPFPRAGEPGISRESAALGAAYASLVACVQELFRQVREGQPRQLAAATAAVQRLPVLQPGQYEAVLKVSDAHAAQHYLVTHSVQTAWLASHLGRLQGYEDGTAHGLALAGLLIALDMASQIEAPGAEATAAGTGVWKVVEHTPAQIASQLRQSHDAARKALDAAGAGGAGGDGLPAAILAVADLYDALTHPRSYRRPINPAHAVKLLIDAASDQLYRRVVKGLVDELSLYPRGSLVKLSTNEIGVVEHANHQAPLRPIVLIQQDANRGAVVPPRPVNLAEHPLMHVKDILVDERA